MYSCHICHHKTGSLKAYSRHYRLHSNVPNIRIPCGYQKCQKQFSNYNSLNSHITREHSFLRQSARVQRRMCQPTSEKYSSKCALTGCGETFLDFQSLLAHLKFHMRGECPEEISCPYHNCDRKYSLLSSFTSHLSKCHKLETIQNEHDISNENDPALLEGNCSDNSQPGGVVSNMADADRPTCSEEMGADDGSDDIEEEDRDFESLFTDHLALFYLKLQAKYLVPSSTLQVIADSIGEINELGQRRLKLKLHCRLRQEIEDEEKLDQLVSDVFENDLIQSLHSKGGALSTEYLRNQYYQKHFKFVSPTEIRLGYDEENKPRYYHYVPIKDTILSLFDQSEVQRQYSNPIQFIPNIIQDFNDGKRVQSCELFQSFPDALKLILYQDGFEVVNPLGAAKRRHKVIGVYLSLGNLHPYSRSKIDPMQLVIMCKEGDMKKFGSNILFERVVKDIQEIEEKGLYIPAVGKNVKGTLLVVLGDNLGSHGVAGFTENFSTAEYLCRFCCITREAFQKGRIDPALHEKRTPENYDAAIKHLEKHPYLTSFKGIKFNSVFNQLKYFHVCSPGFPPCLGHDIFEGVLQYDLPLFMKNLILDKKWFTVEYLNWKIKHFQYKEFEVNDKPPEFNIKSERLAGHAVQNWCLLRLLPMLVGEKIKECTDEVWQLILLLHDIVNYACAHRISLSQVAHMNILIKDYIHNRTLLFPEKKLRPKHHYLCHYAELTLQFSPLLHVMTLRFESKHSYFKRSIRMAQNFKNVTLTMSQRHQLLQSFYSCGSLFGSLLEIENSSEFIPELYAEGIQKAICSIQDISKFKMSGVVVFRGVVFKVGQMVVLHSSVDSGCLNFGQIVLILSKGQNDQDGLVFTVRKYGSKILMERRCFELHAADGDQPFVCVPATELLDTSPLPLHLIKGQKIVCLRHSVPSYI